MKRYYPTTEYIGSGEYIGDMVLDPEGEWVNYEEVRNILREALNAMINLSPRAKEYDGCFGRMAGGTGGEDCICTACKLRREIGDK